MIKFEDLANANKNLEEKIIEYIKCFPQIIRDIFLDTSKDKNKKQKNFDIEKIINRLSSEKLLVPIVNKFLEFELYPQNFSNQQMGYIFEELIRRFSENKTAGEHYTPREVVELLCKLAICKTKFKDSQVINLGDFACGTGGILSKCYDILLQETKKQKVEGLKIKLFGQEINPMSYAFCVADMLINGQDPEKIICASTLEVDKTGDEKFDFIIENPPFGES
jgi:type I restriction enzyme M protein